MASVNLTLPKIKMEDLQDDAKLQKILSYLYTLNEQLRYELTHIDDNNFSSEGISEKVLPASINRTLKNSQGDVLKLYASAKKLMAELSSVQESQGVTEERVGKLEMTSEQLEIEFTYIQESQDELIKDVSDVKQTATEITSTVTHIEEKQDALTEEVSEVKQTAQEITSTVSRIEEDQNEMSESISEVKQTADGINAKITAITIGSRNLIRNSEDLLFDNYYFTGQLVVTHDGAGNVTVVSGGSAFIGDSEGSVIFKTAASVSHDGAGNVTIA